MNPCTIFVYRTPMRALIIAFLLPIHLAAQPGWRELEFSFLLEHHGVEVPANELRQGNEFSFEVEGERAQPFTYNHSRFSTVEFPASRSDITLHRDTLWLRIRHRHEGVMAIGFPPRRGARTVQRYATENVVVPFAPGRVLVTDLPKQLRVTGVLEGLGIPWQSAAHAELSAHCGGDTVLNVAKGIRPAMDFTLRCRTRLRDGLEQAELVFFTRGGPYRPELEMVVRGNVAGGSWPLDTVPFRATRLVKGGGRPLEPDDAGPRDEVLGIHDQHNWLRISPVNPAPGGSVRFTFQWLGGGERLAVTHALRSLGNDTTELVLTVQRAPFEIDPRPRFQLNAVAHEVPALPPGIYRLRVAYSEEAAWPVPRFPETDGVVMRVGDR
jgi:hypothetical protein